MIKSPFSIEAIVLGRNDEYEPNWAENLVASIVYNRSKFEDSAVDYRVCFVEWNPPGDKPLIAPGLIDRFSFLRGIVVDADVHKQLCESRRLTMMLNFAYNCALRTSRSDYCLISAGDHFLGETLSRYIKEVGLIRRCLYRAERVNINRDIDFKNATPAVIENPENIASVDTCTEPPYDLPPYTNASGDFLMTDRLTMLGLRGYDESIRSARLHLDSRFCRTAMYAGLSCNLIGQIFHINHRNSFIVQKDDYPDDRYDYHRNLPYLNTRNWGLADHFWSQLRDRYWHVSRPVADGRSTIPSHLSDEETEAINAVTIRVISRKRKQRPDDPHPEEETLSSALLEAFTADPQWLGAKIRHGVPTLVETTPTAWGYSAMLNLPPGSVSQIYGGDFLYWEVDAKVLTGSVGVGLLHRGEIVSERLLMPNEKRQKIYLPVAEQKVDLMVRNGEKERISRIELYGVRLVRQKPIAINEDEFLLQKDGTGLSDGH